MHKSITVLLAVLLLAALTGQAAADDYVSGQTAEAYAYVHGGYVGKASVTVMWDGSCSVYLDEAFLPHTLAIVDYESAEWTDANTAYYVSRGNEVRVAKYVEYDGTVYVGTTVGGSLTYVEAGDSGEAVGGKDLELGILRNQASMAAYFNNAQAGGFKILTGFGRTAMPVTETHYGGVTKKNAPGYWANGRTWLGNMSAIEVFIFENGADFSNSEMVRADADADGYRFWSAADAVSGATSSDFPDYINVAQAAISKLKKK